MTLEHRGKRLTERNAEGVVDEHAVRDAGTELGRERDGVGDDVRRGEVARGEGGEYHDRGHRRDGVADRVEPAVGVHAAADELGQAPEDCGRHYDERHQWQRDQEERGDQDELIRKCLDAADLERHAPGDRSEEHDADQDGDVDAAIRRHHRHDGAGGDDEDQGECRGDDSLSGGHRLPLTRARLADQFL